MKPRGRKFSIVSSLKDFCNILRQELFSAGERDESNRYYRAASKTNMADIRETDKPHSPLIEMMFVFMACILFTMLFKCAIYSMNPAMFDISSDTFHMNIIILVLSLGLIALEFRKIYRPEPN